MQTQNVFFQKYTHVKIIQKNLIQTKKAEHIPSGYSWITCCSLDTSENEWHHYNGEDCMKKFCKDIKNQAMKIINY